jgi:quinol monooxygenase YgiN
MSVLITVKFQGDTDTFRQALVDRADEFEKVSGASRAAGAIHHRFGVGDGFVLVIDEWDSFEHFEQFFSNPDLQAFVGSVGAAPAPPEITVSEAVASADQF